MPGSSIQAKSLRADAIMTAGPLTIPAAARLKEAIALMQRHHLTALPVVDGLQRPLGVLSQTDIVRYLYENPEYRLTEVDYYAESFPEGGLMTFEISEEQDIGVQEVMTPVIYSVAPAAAAAEVIDSLLEHRVHRLFVTAEEGRLLGVISTLDLLKHLRQHL